MIAEMRARDLVRTAQATLIQMQKIGYFFPKGRKYDTLHTLEEPAVGFSLYEYSGSSLFGNRNANLASKG